FEVGAVDYLLKPFGRRRVEEAVGRVRARFGAANSAPEWESVLKRLEEQRKVYVSQVPVHSGKRILIVPVTDVLWFGVEYRLVYAHTAARAFMTNYTLRDLEERLDPALFFRAHQSNPLNLAHVKAIPPWSPARSTCVMPAGPGSGAGLGPKRRREIFSLEDLPAPVPPSDPNAEQALKELLRPTSAQAIVMPQPAVPRRTSPVVPFARPARPVGAGVDLGSRFA